MALLFAVGRHDAREKHRHDTVRWAVPQDLEHDIFTGLELGNSLAIVVDRSDGLTVYLGDDVARGELNFVGKTSGLDFADQHALLTLHTHTLGLLGSQTLDVESKLRGRCFIGSVGYAARGVRDDMRTVFNRGTGFFFLFIAIVGNPHLAAYRRRSNGIHQVVTVLDRSTIDGGDHVAAFETRLFRWTARLDGFNHDPVGGTQGFQGDLVRSEFFLEAHTDRAASDAAAFHNLVIDT